MRLKQATIPVALGRVLPQKVERALHVVQKCQVRNTRWFTRGATRLVLQAHMWLTQGTLRSSLLAVNS